MTWPIVERIRLSVAAASHQRGLEFLRRNQVNRALLELDRAVRLSPANAEFLKNLGNAQKTAGKPADALKSYRRSLEIAPDYVPAIYNLALILRETGRREEAERQFRRACELDPGDADALFHLGSVLAELARFAEAVDQYRRALGINPDNPYLWLAIALACLGLPGQAEESERCLRKCIELKPDFVDAHYQLGALLYGIGRLDDAARAYEDTLQINPDHLQAHSDLGNILQNERRYREAEAHSRAAIRIAPGDAVAHFNLGNVLLSQGELNEAARHYQKAIELQPDLSDAHQNLGAIHTRNGARDQAIRHFASALKYRPGNAIARENLLHEMQQICDWSRFSELNEQLLEDVRRGLDQPVAPFSLVSLPSTPQEQLQCARHYAAHRARAVARDRERLRFHFERKPKARLRIGWLSADFREHPGAHLIAELIELLDRNRLELFAYSYGPDDRSSIRERLTRSFDRFVDVAPLSHAEAATRIHGDTVDILLDLTGYAMFGRPEILALRPAPIQVNFLGYPGTMGAEFIDYLLSSAFVTPLEHAANYSEALVLMPGNHHVSDRKRAVAQTPSRRELGLPDGAFVFCCLNQTVKILPNVYAAWMRLLKAVPDSIVWLVDSDPLTVGNLRREAQQHGVGPERLVFAPRVPIAHHLARLRAADLFLDTFPYNAHSTAADALWVGLPVLTCAGATFASRMAASFLDCIGLPELITYSLEDYEALALRLARDRDATAALREKLSRNRQTSTLFDTSRYATHLESAFHHMWNRFQAGDAPRAIEL